jgi:hypothetical protein
MSLPQPQSLTNGHWLILLFLAGCTSAASKTHPVNGKVELKDGDIALLKGSHVVLTPAAEPDNYVRPDGILDANGAFSLQTLIEGDLLSGAPEGNYKVRIELADENDEGIPKRPPNLVHRRYLDFETSGLKLSVPSGDYNLTIGSK